ncbi:unnamed protein product [Cuscuta europaea]|uniref:GRF-type domain-containing protein n=1 Tax=Cuscuta europaea TaxID=41803 RepID=A0A9P1EL07_CUSEU|nr:unnamed protein product [Cuscuta europaea]
MKAPLCKGRESGRLFYDCQQFKHDRGCGFFVWKDAMDATHGHTEYRNLRDDAAHGGGLFELQRANNSMGQQIIVLGRDIAYLRGVVQTEGKQNKMLRLFVG